MWYQKAIALCLLLITCPSLAQDDSYLQQLIHKSRDLHLAERIEWLNLLHFKPYPFWTGTRSLADDPSFFNAPNGKHDAVAELESTLKVFFSTSEETDNRQNPQCRFVARFHWLNQQLKFDASQMKIQECRRFKNWIKAINPHELTLVFASAYMNSPGSMYGHTLLRIDAADQDDKTRLLAYTIGYAAHTDSSNGFLYAVLGLTGGYQGRFQILPYYIKVRDYSDLENRDIWEYRLNLTDEELQGAIMHMWELGPTYFDYYFLDENCAYQLLSILEVARPTLKLTDKFRWWAIPSDTVRAIVEENGLMKEVIYRPANSTVIVHRLQAMTPKQRHLAKDLTYKIISPDDIRINQLNPQQKAEVLELSLEYMNYLNASNSITPETGELVHKLLIARSNVDAPNATPLILTPAIRPDQGHKSLRVGIADGVKDGLSYQELTLRPAYHDQLDPEEGYAHGAQIQFFNLALRHYENSGGMRLEEFTPIDIYSLSPNNDYFQSMSWKINAGWSRLTVSNGNEPLVAKINGGVGRTWQASGLAKGTRMAYIFADATIEQGTELIPQYAIGVGPAAGVLEDLNSNWRINVYARVQRFELGDLHTEAELTMAQRYSIGAQDALRLTVTRKQEFDWLLTEAQISWQHFF